MPSLWWPAVRPPTAYRAALPFRSPQSAICNPNSAFRPFPIPGLALTRSVGSFGATRFAGSDASRFTIHSSRVSPRTPHLHNPLPLLLHGRAIENAHRARSPRLIVQMYRLLQTGLDWNLGGFGRGGDPGQWSAEFRARHASAVCDIRTPPYVLVNRHS